MPRPRLHLIRFHGVLAPNAKLRALMVPLPRAPEEITVASELAATESGCTHARPARISWARLLKRVLAATSSVRLKVEQDQLVSVGWWFGLRLAGLQGA